MTVTKLAYLFQMYINDHSVFLTEINFLLVFLPCSGTCPVHGHIQFVTLNPEVLTVILLFKIYCPENEP